MGTGCGLLHRLTRCRGSLREELGTRFCDSLLAQRTNARLHSRLHHPIENGTAPVHLILETKGYDPLEEVKKAAAERWVDAVNADGTYGRWRYTIAKKTTEVPEKITVAAVP